MVRQSCFGFPHVAMFDDMRFFSLFGLAGILEFAGGILLLFGIYTRPVAFVLSGEMAVAYFLVHAEKSFYPILNQGELAALYCFVLLYLAAAGGGPSTSRATNSRLPLDRTADGRRLILRRHAGGRDGPHGLDKLPPRPRWKRPGPAFVEAAPVFQLELPVIAKIIRRADRAIGAGHGLALIVKIGKRQFVQACEEFHIGEGILRIVFGIIRANRGEAEPLREEPARILGEAGGSTALT